MTCTYIPAVFLLCMQTQYMDVCVNEYLADVSNSLRKTLFHHLKGILCCETEKEYSQIIMYIQATNNYAGIDHIPESELSSKNLISSKRI